jgi:gas vesicle protein
MTAGTNGYSTMGIAFVTGAVIGVGTALLMAPYSGAKTRRLLRHYAENAKEDIWEKGQEAVGVLDEAICEGKKFMHKAHVI